MRRFLRVWCIGAVVLVAFGLVGLLERWPTDAVVAWLLVSIAWAVLGFAGLGR